MAANGDEPHQPLQDRRIRYKRFLESNYEEIPRSTAYRRHKKVQRLEAEAEEVGPHLLPLTDNEEDYGINEESSSSDEAESIYGDDNAIESSDDEDDSGATLDQDEGGADNAEDDMLVDSDPEDEDEQPVQNDRELLYDGSRITKEESAALIMSFVIRHQVTDLALIDLLELLNLHMPIKVYKSKYLFLKKFPTDEPQKHFYCPLCQNYLDFSATDNNEIMCDECEHVATKETLNKNMNYFLQFPLKNQIKKLLEKDNVQSEIKKHKVTNDSNILKSKNYKRLQDIGAIKENDVSLQFNTDGARPLKSGNKTLWPIQSGINELPLKLRAKYTLLSGLWYGNKKPRMDTFLRPTVAEYEELHRDGVEVSGKQVCVHTILSPVDSQARYIMQNITMYNGKYGCSFCMKKGTTIKSKRGHARAYVGIVKKPRSEQQHIVHCREALNTNSIVKGVKGTSPLMYIPTFDIIYSFVPEYLHCICLGVVKTFLTELIDHKNKGEDWYIGGHVAELNRRLKLITPVSEITRLPSALELLGQWKGSEFKNFLLYYSIPVLKDVLPDVYLEHWMLLIFSMRIFLSSKIKSSDIRKCKKALIVFVTNVQSLYKIQLNTFNVHLLLHLHEHVENWGAIWDCSAFSYEHFNGYIMKLFHGTVAIPEQIFRTYQRVRNLIHQEPFNDESLNDAANFFAKMLEHSQHIKKGETIGDVSVFHKLSNENLSTTEMTMINEYIHNENVELQYYGKFIYKGVMCHTQKYNRMTSRNNSVVQMKDSNYIKIQCLVIVNGVEQNSILLGKLLDLDENVLCRNEELDICSKDVIRNVRSEGEYVIYNLSDMKCKAVYFSIDDECFVSSLVNPYERD